MSMYSNCLPVFFHVALTHYFVRLFPFKLVDSYPFDARALCSENVSLRNRNSSGN